MNNLKIPQEPLVLPRWSLYAIYLLFMGQGFALVFTDSIATPKLGLADYLIPYGYSMVALSATALLGAYKRWEWLECAFSFLLFSLLTSFVAATLVDWFTDITDRGALGIVAVIAALIPALRSVVLFHGLIWRRRVGKK